MLSLWVLSVFLTWVYYCLVIMPVFEKRIVEFRRSKHRKAYKIECFLKGQCKTLCKFSGKVLFFKRQTFYTEKEMKWNNLFILFHCLIVYNVWLTKRIFLENLQTTLYCHIKKHSIYSPPSPPPQQTNQSRDLTELSPYACVWKQDCKHCHQTIESDLGTITFIFWTIESDQGTIIFINI